MISNDHDAPNIFFVYRIFNIKFKFFGFVLYFTVFWNLSLLFLASKCQENKAKYKHYPYYEKLGDVLF